MSGKEFYLMQVEWTRQVRTDRRMPDKAVRIADALAFDFMNKDVGAAWPSMATLCAHVDASERAVRRVLDQLVQGGHLVIKSGGGRRQSNRYKWILSAGNSGKNAVVSDGETPAYAEEFTRPKRKRNSGTFGAKTTANMPEEPLEENHLNRQTGAGGPNGRKEPGAGSVTKGEDTDASGKALPSHSTASNSGEAPSNGASPVYEPDADAIVLNEDCSGLKDVTQPQNSAGSAPRPPGFRADRFIGMKPEQAQDAAEEYFAESFSPEFQAEMFVQDLADGFYGGDRYGRDGVARALSAELCGLSAREAARRLDAAFAVSEALLTALGCTTASLRSDLTDLAQSILSELTRGEVKHVGRA